MGNAAECRQVTVDAETGILFLAWMREHRLGRKRLLATLLATLLAARDHRAGVTRITTGDWRDVSLYKVIAITHV